MCCIIKFKKKKIRIKKKNNVDVENCESFKGFGYIYIYRIYYTFLPYFHPRIRLSLVV